MEWIVVLALAIIVVGLGLVVWEAASSRHASRGK
jgi:hypothetical protein